MNKYELAVVVSAKLEDEERAAAVEKVKAYIARFGGTVTDVDDWGKRRLAYEINYKTEGYYVLVEYTASPEFPAELSRQFKITDGIIRYITINQEN